MKYTMLQKLKSKCKSVLKSPSSSVSSTSVEERINEPWFKSSFTRQQADLYLMDKEIGTFVVRVSETNSSCYVLSIKMPRFISPTQVSHYLILKHSDQEEIYSIRGLDKRFSTLKSLIVHYSYLRDMLPIRLNLDYYKSDEQVNSAKKSLFKPSTSTSSICSSVDSNESFISDFLEEQADQKAFLIC